MQPSLGFYKGGNASVMESAMHTIWEEMRRVAEKGLVGSQTTYKRVRKKRCDNSR